MTESITTVNANNIVSSTVVDERLHGIYKYGTYSYHKWSWKQFKFIKIIQEGFYPHYDLFGLDHNTNFYTKEELLIKENVIITEDNEVFHKAYVKTCFLDKDYKIKYFNSYAEALNYHINLSRRMLNNINL